MTTRPALSAPLARLHPTPGVPAPLARADAFPIGWTLRGGRAPHWLSAAGRGGAADADWLLGAQGPRARSAWRHRRGGASCS